MNKFLLLLLLSVPILACENESKLLRLSKHCAKSADNVNIVYSPGTSRLFVDEGNNLIPVEDHSMDNLLHAILKQDSIDHSAFGKFINSCYISAVKQSDDSYYLRSSCRLPGGGPGTALIFYWGTTIILPVGYLVSVGVKKALDPSIPADFSDIGGKLLEVEKTALAMAAIGLVCPTP